MNILVHLVLLFLLIVSVLCFGLGFLAIMAAVGSSRASRRPPPLTERITMTVGQLVAALQKHPAAQPVLCTDMVDATGAPAYKITKVVSGSSGTGQNPPPCVYLTIRETA